jgi:hypothetical protein
MRVSTSYQPIASNVNPTKEQTYFFMINSLLSSRKESGYPSNDQYYDEDVNVYLANLLTTFIYPERYEWKLKYITPYDTELFGELGETEGPRSKYLAYRSNADVLLFSLGIFNNPRRRRPNAAPHMAGGSYIGRGKSYYRLAQSYSQKTFRKSTAVSEVLGKLSDGYEKYVSILSRMKGEYFNLYRRISDGELFHLCRSVEHEGSRQELGSLYNAFLDAYSDYKHDLSPESKVRLENISRRLRRIDPDFRFEPE